MVIKTVRIRNFRSFGDATVRLENLTALVGANGSGKSSVLCALEVFYGQVSSLSDEDFYNRETTREIAITVTYSELSDEINSSFSDYVEGDALSLERVISWQEGKASSHIHGFRMQHTGFDAVRTAATATEKKPLYGKLRDKKEYAMLPQWRNQQDAAEALKAWEDTHKEACKRNRDDGAFFNFKQGSTGDLNRYTRLLPIPAVRNVTSDAVEGRGAVITTLLDMVIRSELARRPAMVEIQTEALEKYKILLSEAELNALAEKLSNTLRAYAPTTSVRLEWQPIDEIEMPTPRAHIRVVEDGFETDAERTGHGVQRAFILALLQRLALAQSEFPAPQAPGPAAVLHEQPSLLLAIEEPELYQHPNRQRHLSDVFMRLATAGIPGVAQKTQVLYTTHSPLLVGLDRFNQVRICRKVPTGMDQPKQTTVASITLELVSQRLWEGNGSIGDKYTGESVIPRLHVLMTPVVGEGFFGDVVVLVEGETDQAAIMAAARVLGHNLSTLGISVIPCRGKSSLDRPAIIFRELGIPTYVVWDGDKGKKNARPEENHRLLRLFGKPMVDWPAGQDAACTIFERDLETTLREELGAGEYDQWVMEALADTGLTKDQGLKNPVVFERVLRSAAQSGKHSPTLNGIVSVAIAKKV
jgi:hypothetical protein